MNTITTFDFRLLRRLAVEVLNEHDVRPSDFPGGLYALIDCVIGSITSRAIAPQSIRVRLRSLVLDLVAGSGVYVSKALLARDAGYGRWIARFHCLTTNSSTNGSFARLESARSCLARWLRQGGTVSRRGLVRGQAYRLASISDAPGPTQSVIYLEATP